MPRTDTFACCDKLNVALGDTNDAKEVHRLQQEKQEHLRKAQQFYTELRASTDMAGVNSNMCCLSFNFNQQHILSLTALAVRVLRTQQLHCWPKTMAHCGANEVVSCLHNYLSTTLLDVVSLMLFSDSTSRAKQDCNAFFIGEDGQV